MGFLLYFSSIIP